MSVWIGSRTWWAMGIHCVEFPDDMARLPVQIKQFDDEYRVTAVAPGTGEGTGRSRLEDSRHAHRACPRTPTDAVRRRMKRPFSRRRGLRGFSRWESFCTAMGSFPTAASLSSLSWTKRGVSSSWRPAPSRRMQQINWVPRLQRAAIVPPEAQTRLAGTRTCRRHAPCIAAFRGYNGLSKHSAGLFKLVSEQHPDQVSHRYARKWRRRLHGGPPLPGPPRSRAA